jgi:hypothetical protein
LPRQRRGRGGNREPPGAARTKDSGMSGDPDSLVLTMLRAIRGDVGQIKGDITEIKERIGFLEGSYASLSRRVDRMGGDVEMIKRRLDIVDAPVE